MTSLVNRQSYFSLGNFLAILLNICLLGCGGIRETKVLKAYDIHKDYPSLTISEGNSKVHVPPEIKDLFKVNLNNLLIEKGKFKHGTDLNIVYSYIRFHPGNQSAHHLITGGMGEGSITINVIYVDNTGNEISSIQASGKISLGYPINLTIEDCAKQIALYTEENFSNGRTKKLLDDSGKKRKSPEKEINIINGKEKMKGWWEPAR